MEMKRTIFGVGAIVFLALTTHLWALDQSRVLDFLLQNGLDADQVGMILQDENGKILALNETKQLKPASLMKILTAGAALEFLGTDSEFKTELLTDGTVKNHVLKGSIYLKGGADPTFDTRALSQFLYALKDAGVQTIRGNIVIDDLNDYDIHTTNMRSWEQAPNPGKYPLFVNIDPPSKLQPGTRAWLRTKGRLRRLIALNEDYVVYQNMVQPDLWTGQDFVLMLRRARIRVTGKLMRGKAPEEASVMETVSTPLIKVIHDMLKSSNNFYADMMIRNLAMESGEKPAVAEKGMQLLFSFLDHVGVSHEQYSLNSGAGFTHSSYITAGALCAVLNYLREQPEVSSIFFDSLPVAGEDGTLKYRMRRTEAQGNVHAKTGYLGRLVTRSGIRDGVVALAGFATSATNKNVTFVFVYNGTRSPNFVRSIFDKLCVELVTDPEL